MADVTFAIVRKIKFNNGHQHKIILSGASPQDVLARIEQHPYLEDDPDVMVYESKPYASYPGNLQGAVVRHRREIGIADFIDAGGPPPYKQTCDWCEEGYPKAEAAKCGAYACNMIEEVQRNICAPCSMRKHCLVR